jgi:virulence-associated protein VagC
MSIVETDGRGRVTIPKEVRLEADRALIIPIGGSYMIVPIPKAPVEFVVKEERSTSVRRECQTKSREKAS